MTSKPLFITGVARGGTSLIGRMIDAHPEASISIDAFLPLVIMARNRMVRACPDARISTFDTSRALQDGHFTAPRRSHLEALLRASMDVEVPKVELEALRLRLKDRAADEAKDLVPLVEGLEGNTLGDLYGAAAAAAHKVRKPDALVSGIKDVWLVDQFPALHRAFSEARFIIILRDPRAIIASILGYLETDPTQCAHALSVLRHWRKMLACAVRFSSEPTFAERLLVIRYEDVVQEPLNAATEISAFLDLADAPQMADASAYNDVTRGGAWKGNSTFDGDQDGISTGPVARWRKTLDEGVVAAVEYCCAADMSFAGYEPSLDPARLDSDPSVLEFLIRDGQRESSWRSDFGDPFLDYGFEAARRCAISSCKIDDPELISNSYLFDDYYEALKSGRTMKAQWEASTTQRRLA